MSGRRLGSIGAVWLGIGACLLSACGGGGEATAPNLLVVTMDTTRADHLGSYGFAEASTPSLDAFAARSVRFERAFAHVPVTLPSHTSLFTGSFPVTHGVRDNGRFVVPDGVVTLAERLADRGYETAAFVSAFVLDSRYGLDQGFGTYDDDYTEDWSEERIRDARIYNQMVTDRPADATTERALAWLGQTPSEPFFLWVHYYDPHQRYDPPHPWNQLFQDRLYDGEIAFMDSQIGRLFGRVEELGLWRDTAVVVTADHGESLDEHGEKTHGVLTYDGTLRVPLMIKAPGDEPPGGPVEAPVSHVDVLPTVLELLGLPAAAGLDGRSLLPAMRGDPLVDRPAYFESHLPHFSFGWAPQLGVREGRWKYVHGADPELYDLTVDPGELIDLAAREPGRMAEMEDLLFQVVEASRSRAPEDTTARLDDDARKQLLALGYAGGGGTDTGELDRRTPSSRRAPRDGIHILADYYVANGLSGRGRLHEAAAIYRDILLPLDPDNPTFVSNLANLERRLGRSERALELLRRAQALDPSDPEVLVQLGQLEEDLGRPEAAEALFAAAGQLDPDHLGAAFLGARLASAEGRSEDAVDRYRRVLRLDPGHRDARINLGIEHARREEWVAAERELATAIDLFPFASRAHYNLARLRLAQGEPGRAVQSFEAALRYRQPYPLARLGLAEALLADGRGEEGRAELQELEGRIGEGPMAVRIRELLDGGGEGATDEP